MGLSQNIFGFLLEADRLYTGQQQVAGLELPFKKWQEDTFAGPAGEEVRWVASGRGEVTSRHQAVAEDRQGADRAIHP